MSIKKDIFKKEGELLKQRFFEPHCGRFFIYFNDITSNEIIEGILYYLMNGYVMSVADDGDGNKMYVLFSLELDTRGYREVTACHKILKRLLSDCGVEEFWGIPFKEYQRNKKYQEAIDYVLEQACFEDNMEGGWSIAMLVNGNGEFHFVEVLDACE